jgi:hypothetical protein
LFFFELVHIYPCFLVLKFKCVLILEKLYLKLILKTIFHSGKSVLIVSTMAQRVMDIVYLKTCELKINGQLFEWPFGGKWMIDKDRVSASVLCNLANLAIKRAGVLKFKKNSHKSFENFCKMKIGYLWKLETAKNHQKL